MLAHTAALLHCGSNPQGRWACLLSLPFTSRRRLPPLLMMERGPPACLKGLIGVVDRMVSVGASSGSKKGGLGYLGDWEREMTGVN